MSSEWICVILMFSVLVVLVLAFATIARNNSKLELEVLAERRKTSEQAASNYFLKAKLEKIRNILDGKKVKK